MQEFVAECINFAIIVVFIEVLSAFHIQNPVVVKQIVAKAKQSQVGKKCRKFSKKEDFSG